MRKIHWNSDCTRTIDELEKKYKDTTTGLIAEIDFVRSHNLILSKENTELKERIVKQCEEYRFTATMEDNAVNMFNKLSPMYDSLVAENALLKKEIESLKCYSQPQKSDVVIREIKKPSRKKKGE